MGRVWRSVVQGGLAAGGLLAARQVLLHMEERKENTGVAKGKRILILGAGFGGLGVAQELARLLPESGNGEITLVDADNYLLFTPMLTEAAGGELDTRHIISSVRKLHDRIRFVQGRVTRIDVHAKSATVSVGAENLDPAERTFTADHMVIALGSVTSYHHLPGVKENSFSMKSLHDAAAVCAHVLACLQRANSEEDAAKRKELLTFAVGGGGFTGVETMAAMNDLVRERARQFDNLPAGEIRTVIIHPGKRLLEEITPELAAYTGQKLKERGVEVQLNAKIASAGPDFVQVEGGERIPTRTLVWAAGVTPSPVIEQTDVPKGKHHGITVEGTCQIGGVPGVWALGDCAEIPKPDGQGTYAPTAQNATREGKLIARNIAATLRGQEPKPFVYKPIGELALVGRRSGVARVFGMNFSGMLAWAMWRAVYLAKMPGTGQQARILGDWVFDVLFGREPMPVTADSSASASDGESTAKAAA